MSVPSSGDPTVPASNVEGGVGYIEAHLQRVLTRLDEVEGEVRSLKAAGHRHVSLLRILYSLSSQVYLGTRCLFRAADSD
jgi:hypothetical protein